MNPRLLAGEITAAKQFARLAWRAPGLVRATRGATEPVLLLPGYGTTDLSNYPLRRYLQLLGYQASGWGLGRNRGDMSAMTRDVGVLVERLADESGKPVHLLGWSLGGSVARSVARRHPLQVAQVITYGSPILDRHHPPLPVPLTVIYSKVDGVVPWQSSVDNFTPGASNIEVNSTHLGMGFDPDVWRIVTQKLAEHSPRVPDLDEVGVSRPGV